MNTMEMRILLCMNKSLAISSTVYGEHWQAKLPTENKRFVHYERRHLQEGTLTSPIQENLWFNMKIWHLWKWILWLVSTNKFPGLGSQLNSPVFSLRCSLLSFDVKDHLKNIEDLWLENVDCWGVLLSIYVKVGYK